MGNPTQTTGTDGRVTYTYDPLDRLTEVCYAALCPGLLDPAIRWTYDAVGNRLTETRPEGTTTYSGVHQPRQPWQNEAHPPWRQEWWRAHVARAPWQTPFPQGWSGDRIMHELSDIATDPASRVVAQQGGRTVLEGTRGGTVIRVVTDGRDIITGFPVR